MVHLFWDYIYNYIYLYNYYIDNYILLSTILQKH